MLMPASHVRPSVAKVHSAFRPGFICGFHQIIGKAKGGTQSNMTTMDTVR